MFRSHNSFVARGVRTLACGLGVGLIVVGAAGCSDDPQAPPRVIFTSSVGRGTHSAAECGQTGSTWFHVGSFGTPQLGKKPGTDELIDPAVPVDNGASEQQGGVSVSCAVVPQGANFDVRANLQLTGATGGAVTITGTFSASGDQKNVTMNLSQRGESFGDSTCIATYSLPGQGIAPGRVWATIDCANAKYSSAQATPQVCTSTATIRLENCGQ